MNVESATWQSAINMVNSLKTGVVCITGKRNIGKTSFMKYCQINPTTVYCDEPSIGLLQFLLKTN
jgi:predicted AAA+ superfamily ATPase